MSAMERVSRTHRGCGGTRVRARIRRPAGAGYTDDERGLTSPAHAVAMFFIHFKVCQQMFARRLGRRGGNNDIDPIGHRYGCLSPELNPVLI